MNTMNRKRRQVDYSYQGTKPKLVPGSAGSLLSA